MVTITYRLTSADIEEARNRSIAQRVTRILASAFLGLLGLLFAYGQILLFRGWELFWKFWPANLISSLIALYLLWLATDSLGLQWFLGRYSGLFASREVCFMGDTLTITSHGTKQTWRWLRDRGWIETPSLLLLPIKSSQGFQAQCVVPKRAFTPEQERDFRECLNTPKVSAGFVLDFFLTEADVRKASRATKTWLATGPGRLFGRTICGLGAIFFLMAPSLDLFNDVHGGWAGMWRTNPLTAAFFSAFCLLGLWVAAGQVGIKRLERYLNHYDQRRTYTFSDADINIRCGDKSRRHLWKHILNFRETPSAFILQRHFLIVYIIPKSALGSYDVEEFRNFLLTKLLPARA